jgi:cytochrome P450/ribosomal protein S18 acetylase RimI-like enzyme
VAYFESAEAGIYFVSAPELIGHVLTADERLFGRGGTITEARRFLGNGLLTSEGEFHLRQRRMIQPAFHRDRIAALGDTMAELADERMARWQDGELIDVHEAMNALAVAIVGRALFGVDLGAEENEIRKALDSLLAMTGTLAAPFIRIAELLHLPAMRRYASASKYFDELASGVIAAGRSDAGQRAGLLTLLLEARDEAGQPMAETQIRDELVTLLLAGHETTSTALAWAFAMVGRQPALEAELHAEVDSVLDGRRPSVSDLERLPLTERIFREALRLFPPAWALSRRALVDFEIGGYVVPRGSFLVVSPFVTHRDPRLWEDPLAFRPERWRDDASPIRHRYSFFPFGGGSRVCIGERFAYLEGRLVLATLAQRWRLRPVSSELPRLSPLLTLRPRGGIHMRVERRGIEAASSPRSTNRPPLPVSTHVVAERRRRRLRRRATRRASTRRAPEVPVEEANSRSGRRLLRRALDVWRFEGPASVARRALGETVHRRLLVVEQPFAEFVAHARPQITVEIERMGPDGVGEYSSLRPDTRSAAIERRLASDEHCFLARRQGRLVGACWVATGKVFIEYLGREVNLARGALYVYDLYVIPELRGKGVDRALYVAMSDFFAGGPWTAIVATTNVENRSERLFERLGMRRSGLLGYYRLGPFRRHFTRLEPGQTAMEL